MTSLVRVSNLAKRFGDKQAVDNLTFDIRPGESVGLLGPNGAGKTTTLLTLLGAVRADSGTIEIAGLPMPKRRSQIMQHVGFAAGYLPLPSRLTVTEALRFFARIYGIHRSDRLIERTLEDFQISHLQAQMIDTLSSGQRTLVGIAKATLHEPQLLVLDEPTASLDPDVADRVRSALASLHESRGTTLLITTHDMGEVDRLCRRVLFVQHGKIIADGHPNELIVEYDQEDLTGLFLHVARNNQRRLVSEERA